MGDLADHIRNVIMAADEVDSIEASLSGGTWQKLNDAEGRKRNLLAALNHEQSLLDAAEEQLIEFLRGEFMTAKTGNREELP